MVDKMRTSCGAKKVINAGEEISSVRGLRERKIKEKEPQKQRHQWNKRQLLRICSSLV